MKEINDKQLQQAIGGWADNGDGTYNIYDGETFRYGNIVYMVIGDYVNVGLETFIDIREFYIDENGNLTGPSIDGKASLKTLINTPIY